MYVNVDDILQTYRTLIQLLEAKLNIWLQVYTMEVFNENFFIGQNK